MLLPHEIRKKEFSLAMGGYARSEVKSYLEYIADNYEKLRRENDELSRRLDAAMEKLDQYHASEMAALAANVKDEEPASDGKTAAVAAILSSLQLEVDMISARIGEINAFLGGTSEIDTHDEDSDRIDEIEEIEPIEENEEIPETVDIESAEESEEVEETAETAETEDAEEIEAVDPTDEIGSLDEIEDETEELAVLDEAESELELLETVEDEVEETDTDGVLVFELPVSVPVVEEASVEEDILEGEAFEESPVEETFEFVEVGEPEEEAPEKETSAEEAPDETEPEQIEFCIPEDAAAEPDADGDEAPEQVDIDDFITDFFDMDGALADVSGEEEEAPAEFVEFVTPEEEPVTEESVEIAFDESAPETTPETAPKKASAKRFHIKKKAAAPKEAPTEETLDEIIATFAEASESAPVEVKDSEPATEATEDDDLEAILRALKVQYDSVTATAGTEDEKFDMTDFDEFNYIFGDSSSKIDIVPEKNDIDDVLYDE